MDIEDELRAIVQKKANGAAIALETKLADLGLDSLDVVEIVFEIEDKFRIQLPQGEQDMSAARFQDLCSLVTQELGGSAPAPSAA
jgi:acyl carrier protein